jgi:hypothetical protein
VCLKRAFCTLFLAVLAISLCSLPLFSQTANGRISGSVKDQTGGAISGAAVVVTDVARGTARNLTTDEAGAYLAPNLIPGTYTVRATFQGFQAWERQNINLPVQGEIVIDVVLLPGAQTQTVTITEELPLVNTTSATLGGTLASETILDLPLGSRNFKNLLDLRPGTVTNLGNDSGGGGAQSVNGLRNESSNEFLVEGLHGLDPFTGQSLIGNLALRGDGATILPADAIQEFSQQFNSKAEYGWKAGASVGVGIKSGTNAFHGTGYAFFRDVATDARDYFNNAATQPKVNGAMQQFGGTFGGPIMQDRLFFFLGYEQQNYTQGSPSSLDLAYTDLGMLNCGGSGALFDCTAIPGTIPRNPVNIEANAANHLMLACLGLRDAGGTLSLQSRSMVSLDSNCNPGPNYPNATNGATWFVARSVAGSGISALDDSATTFYPNTQIENRSIGGVAKVDFNLNEANVINGFIFTGNGNNEGETTSALPIWGNRAYQTPVMVAGTWTWLVNSSVVNSFRVGKARIYAYYRGLDALSETPPADLGLPTGVPLIPAGDGFIENGGYPESFEIAGLNGMGSRNSETRGPGESLEISDQINYLHGNHSFRFGGVIMTHAQNGATWSTTRGTFSFGAGASGDEDSSGLIAFLAGQNEVPALAANIDGTAINIGDLDNGRGLQEASLFYGNPESNIRRMSYSLFAQDDWRVHPRVTLNLGLRYDLVTVPHDKNYILGSFDPNLGIVQEGVQIPSIHNGDHNNFGPRVGFAWDMFGTGRTVLRAGGSMIFELTPLGIYVETGNFPGAAGNPTAFVTGCTVGTLDAGGDLLPNPAPLGSPLITNCQGLGGSLITPGGTRAVGIVEWSEGEGTINNVVRWDGPSSGATTGIFPGAGVLTCSPFVTVRDNPNEATERQGSPCLVTSMDRHLSTPYVQTWSLSLQHAIVNNVVLDVAYVGNHGVKLIGRTDDNQPGLGSGWLDGTGTLLNNCLVRQDNSCDGNRGGHQALEVAAQPFINKFPYLTRIVRVWNPHTSNYNSLQMTLTARNFHGASFTSGYTYAKALDVASSSGTFLQSDAYNVGLDYGRASSDIRQRFTFSSTYQIPGRMGYGGLLEGWKVNGVFRYQTGRPWTPSANRDFAGTGTRGNNISRWDFTGDRSDFAADLFDDSTPGFFPGCPVRADLDPTCSTLPGGINPRTGVDYTAQDMAVNNPTCTAAASSPATLHAFGCWVQGSSAITPPAPVTYGNLMRGIFDGPTYWALDFSVTKRQRISERFEAEFRAETFNTFNHPAFAQPTGGLGCTSSACAFGTVDATPAVDATNAFLGTGGPRRMQFGFKLIF